MIKKLVLLSSLLLFSTTTQAKSVVIETNQGDITLELFEKKFPVTVANFEKYIESGFYKETLFYRVVADFVIQGGNVNRAYEVKTDSFPPIKNEACNDPSVRNVRDAIAMARFTDPDSATSAFYINLKHNTHLDCDGYKYTVFGQVTSGIEVVQKIANQPVREYQDFTHLPVDDVVILNIRTSNK